MSKIIDKKCITNLAESLFIQISDDLVNKIIKELNELQGYISKIDAKKLIEKYKPVNYTRVNNCAKLRPDQPDKKYDKDYLAGAKRADKYVLGK